MDKTSQHHHHQHSHSHPRDSSSSTVYEDPDEFIAELKLSLAEVVDELSFTDSELANERKRTSSLQRDIEHLRKENELLREELENVDRQEESVLMEVQEVPDQTPLKETLQRKQDEMDRLETRWKKEEGRLREETSRMESEWRNVRLELEKSSIRERAFQEECEALKLRLSEAEGKLASDRAEMESLVRSRQKEIARFEAEVDAVNTENDDLRRRLGAAMKADHQRDADRVKALETLVDDLKGTIQLQKDQIEEMLSMASQSRQEWNLELKKLREDAQMKDKELKNLTKERDTAKKRNGEIVLRLERETNMNSQLKGMIDLCEQTLAEEYRFLLSLSRVMEIDVSWMSAFARMMGTMRDSRVSSLEPHSPSQVKFLSEDGNERRKVTEQDIGISSSSSSSLKGDDPEAMLNMLVEESVVKEVSVLREKMKKRVGGLVEVEWKITDMEKKIIAFEGWQAKAETLPIREQKLRELYERTEEDLRSTLEDVRAQDQRLSHMFREFKGMRQSLSELGEIILKVPQIIASVNLDDPRKTKPLLEEFHQFVLDLERVTEEADLRGSLLDIKLRLRLVANAQKKTQVALETRNAELEKCKTKIQEMSELNASLEDKVLNLRRERNAAELGLSSDRGL
eukprot:TRINITY_DN217_c1_g1_i1.p1 TRINITY_DN217_c1_g1~~TRINITY_DN217_c1_g1_i1.p1  ORF type:complete len:630 (+),score=227.01 TRINITY_DN217_c1_g1_i1:48-1937(+)